MAIRNGYPVVLSLVALWGASSLPGAMDPARGAAAEDGAATVEVEAEAEAAGQEPIPEGEAEAIAELEKLQLDQMMLLGGGKPTARGQHPKSHGFLVGTFTVRADLPAHLKVGVFREPGAYTAVIRFSNTREVDDGLYENHGMSIKLLNVAGEMVLNDEPDARTQDFVLLDHPLFFAKDVASTLAVGKAAAALAADPELQMKKIGLTAEQQRWEDFKALARQRPEEALLVAARRQHLASPLATDYFSTTPYRFGTTAVKYRAHPELPPAGPAHLEGRDHLREALVEHLTKRKQPARFTFSVQRQGDPKAMPIEDPTIEWTSPWEPVATIEIAPQVFDFCERKEWGNALSYTPWHALKEHEPLGGINRARKVIYRASSRLRHQFLMQPSKEPTESEIPMPR